jgi:2-dehydropantoate 2-reductase
MQRKYRIAILGIGGVGGFIGGKLAAAYSGSSGFEVIFVTRGANGDTIRENGLKLITDDGEVVIRPDIVTSDPGSVGPVDLVIVATKTYDLENSVGSLSSSITPHTIILPLLNGVDNTEKLQAVTPQSTVLQGCIYLVSKIIAPGVVQQRGAFYAVHFGGDIALSTEMQHLLELFQKANINAILEDDIQGRIWTKFSFISPVATYTSAHDISLGEILESEEHSAAIKALMTELLTLASALNIQLPADSIEKSFAVMAKLPYGTTSSMQADFAAHKPTELETLTGIVVRKASALGISLPAYSALYRLLSERK